MNKLNVDDFLINLDSLKYEIKGPKLKPYQQIQFLNAAFSANQPLIQVFFTLDESFKTEFYNFFKDFQRNASNKNNRNMHRQYQQYIKLINQKAVEYENKRYLQKIKHENQNYLFNNTSSSFNIPSSQQYNTQSFNNTNLTDLTKINLDFTTVNFNTVPVNPQVVNLIGDAHNVKSKIEEDQFNQFEQSPNPDFVMDNKKYDIFQLDLQDNPKEKPMNNIPIFKIPITTNNVTTNIKIGDIKNQITLNNNHNNTLNSINFNQKKNQKQLINELISFNFDHVPPPPQPPPSNIKNTNQIEQQQSDDFEEAEVIQENIHTTQQKKEKIPNTAIFDMVFEEQVVKLEQINHEEDINDLKFQPTIKQQQPEDNIFSLSDNKHSITNNPINKPPQSLQQLNDIFLKQSHEYLKHIPVVIQDLISISKEEFRHNQDVSHQHKKVQKKITEEEQEQQEEFEQFSEHQQQHEDQFEQFHAPPTHTQNNNNKLDDNKHQQSSVLVIKNEKKVSIFDVMLEQNNANEQPQIQMDPPQNITFKLNNINQAQINLKDNTYRQQKVEIAKNYEQQYHEYQQENQQNKVQIPLQSFNSNDLFAFSGGELKNKNQSSSNNIQMSSLTNIVNQFPNVEYDNLLFDKVTNNTNNLVTDFSKINQVQNFQNKVQNDQNLNQNLDFDYLSQEIQQNIGSTQKQKHTIKTQVNQSILNLQHKSNNIYDFDFLVGNQTSHNINSNNHIPKNNNIFDNFGENQETLVQINNRRNQELDNNQSEEEDQYEFVQTQNQQIIVPATSHQKTKNSQDNLHIKQQTKRIPSLVTNNIVANSLPSNQVTTPIVVNHISPTPNLKKQPQKQSKSFMKQELNTSQIAIPEALKYQKQQNWQKIYRSRKYEHNVKFYDELKIELQNLDLFQYIDEINSQLQIVKEINKLSQTYCIVVEQEQQEQTNRIVKEIQNKIMSLNGQRVSFIAEQVLKQKGNSLCAQIYQRVVAKYKEYAEVLNKIIKNIKNPRKRLESFLQIGILSIIYKNTINEKGRIGRSLIERVLKDFETYKALTDQFLLMDKQQALTILNSQKFKYYLIGMQKYYKISNLVYEFVKLYEGQSNLKFKLNKLKTEINNIVTSINFKFQAQIPLIQEDPAKVVLEEYFKFYLQNLQNIVEASSIEVCPLCLNSSTAYRGSKNYYHVECANLLRKLNL